jgi:uncharacterized membrane protein YuzA (DUF378 family)
MKKMNAWDWVSFVLLVIGGLNWGLVGLFNYNLVTSLFGMSTLSNIIFDLVGLAAIYAIVMAFAKPKEMM